MLDTLRFVKGGIAKKDFVVQMNHFHIKNGTITSFNGVIELQSPINLNLEISPRAESLIKAVEACKDETISLHITKSGALHLKSGNFKVSVPCLPDKEAYTMEDHKPVAGTKVKLRGNLIPTFKLLLPFISEDASRPWSRGILFTGGTAMATNNVIVVQKWLGGDDFLENINLPRAAITEMIRIGEEPEYYTTDNNHVTFFYSGQRWLKSSLLTTEWPDMNNIFQAQSQFVIRPELWESLEQVKPLLTVDRGVFINGRVLATSNVEGEGALINAKMFDGIDEFNTVIYNIDMLLLLKNVATKIGLQAWPKPACFTGESLRGAIAGVVQK